MTVKVCTKCKQAKPPEEFAKLSRMADGLNYWCKACHNAHKIAWRHTDKGKAAADRWKRDNPRRVMLYSARARARKSGVPCTIALDDIFIPDICPVLGIKLVAAHDGKTGNAPNSPSLDKIDPKLGYVPGNVQVISQRANVMKNDASPKDLLAMADWIYKTFHAYDDNSGVPSALFYGAGL